MRKPPFTIAEHLERGMAKAIEVGECVEWQGAFSCNGVTPVLKVRMPGGRNSDNIAVCRVLWEAKHGSIGEGKLVYRTCCNNNCVNLDHLAVGTRKQWVAHRKRNGKTKHKQTTKLKMTVAARQRANVVNTLEKARAVRSLRGEMSNRAIAKVTGVSEAMVSDINAGVAWKEVISNPFAGLMG